MYIVLDKTYNNKFGNNNVFGTHRCAKIRANSLNKEFPANSFKVFELKEIE